MTTFLTDHTPVLVGIGTATQCEANFERALEPMDLMHAAVAAAGCCLALRPPSKASDARLV